MLNFKIIKTVFQTLMILAVIWGTFFIVASAYNKLENNNLNFIPASADIIIQIDTKSLMKQSISGLIKHKDNDFIQLLKDLSSESGAPKETNPNGIAYNTDVILFKLPNKGGIGAIFNLRNSDYFSEYYAKKSELSVAVNEHVGMILFTPQPNNENSTTAHTLLAGSHVKLANEETEESLVIWTKNTHQEFDKATVQIMDSVVKIEGEIANQFEQTPGINPIMPNGFHATLATIPATFNDSIQNRFGDSIPTIAGISFNYFGTELIEEPEFLIAPLGDFLIEFEDSVNIEYFKEYFLKTPIIDSIVDNKFYYGPKLYHTHQLSDQLIYFGVDDYETIKHSNSSPLVHLSGDLTQLTLIEGGGFFKRVMEIIPSYGASKLLASKIELFDISLIEDTPSTSIIEGEIKMKDNASASVEFLRFLLIGQFLQ